MLKNPNSVRRVTPSATKVEWGEGGVLQSAGQEKGRVTQRRGRAISDLHERPARFAKAGAKNWTPFTPGGPGTCMSVCRPTMVSVPLSLVLRTQLGLVTARETETSPRA